MLKRIEEDKRKGKITRRKKQKKSFRIKKYQKRRNYYYLKTKINETNK